MHDGALIRGDACGLSLILMHWDCLVDHGDYADLQV